MQNLLSLQKSLRDQLAQVDSLITRNSQPQNQNLEAMVNQAVQRQLSNVLNPFNTILSSIGECLSKENQEWLSSNLDKLPQFIRSDEGKETINLLLESY